MLNINALLLSGSACYKALHDIIASPYLLRDIGKMSPLEQTAGLEAFHSVIGYFAPKNVHFFHGAMKARLVCLCIVIIFMVRINPVTSDW